MRVATVDGLVTLYYDGSKELYNRELDMEWIRAIHERRRNTGHVEVDDFESLNLSVECKRYIRERFTWEQIIVVDGVTEIPEWTFCRCLKVKRVIFANTVIRIQRGAFFYCKNLVYAKWPLRLEFIGGHAFGTCNLSSVFITPRCREIGTRAFAYNENLTILNISQDTEVDNDVILATKLLKSCHHTDTEAIKTWIKNINHHENFALHRACASYNPLKEVLQTIVQEKGLKAFREENGIGITPSQYLKENPYAEVTEKAIIEDYILQMIGER